MSSPNNIHLNHYQDGMPSVLRKKTVFTELFFYRKSDVLVQLTKAFCERFLPKYGDRTVDQMVQAARSIKQNIAEGLTDGQTSFEVEIKLLGIAKGSNQELLEDYQDYLKQHGLRDWAKAANDRDSRLSGNSGDSSNSRNSSLSSNSSNSLRLRYEKLLAYCRTHNDLTDYEPFYQKWTDEEMCNTAICLCHMVDRAMSVFLEKRDREFVEEGGIRERMTAARLDMRGTQKQTIARLEAENATLRAQVESMRREIETLRKERKD